MPFSKTFTTSFEEAWAFHSSTNKCFKLLFTLFKQTMNSFRFTLHPLSTILFFQMAKESAYLTWVKSSCLSMWENIDKSPLQCYLIKPFVLKTLTHRDFFLPVLCLHHSSELDRRPPPSIAKCRGFSRGSWYIRTPFSKNVLLAWIIRCK